MCQGGPGVSISGKIERILPPFRSKYMTIEIKEGSEPCEVNTIWVLPEKVPPSCKAGRIVRARGTIDDGEDVVLLPDTALECQ